MGTGTFDLLLLVKMYSLSDYQLTFIMLLKYLFIRRLLHAPECRLLGLPTKIPIKLFLELCLPEKWWKKLSYWYLQIKCKLILPQRKFLVKCFSKILFLLSRETASPRATEEWTPPGVKCMMCCMTCSRSLTMTEPGPDRQEALVRVRARDTRTGWWTCPGAAARSTQAHTSFMPAVSVIKLLLSAKFYSPSFFSQPISRRPKHHPLLLPSHGQARGQEPRPGLGI